MAGWAAKSEQGKKSCKECNRIRGSVPEKHRDKLLEQECLKCEVFLSQPNCDNEVILDLYNYIPHTYGEWSGSRILTASDIKFVFEVFEVPRELWDDYYERLMLLHNEITDFQAIQQEKESKKSTKGGSTQMPITKWRSKNRYKKK